MINRRFFCSLILFMAAALHAGLTGDLNADGKLDIADYVRIMDMCAGTLTQDTKADLDHDGQITDTDADILLGLIRGTCALPEVLDYELTYEDIQLSEYEWTTIRSYQGEGFKFSAENSYQKTVTPSFWTVDALPESPLSEDFTCSLSQTIGVNNLPHFYDMEITLDVPKNIEGQPALLFGSQLRAKGAKEKLWSYRIIEVDGEELVYKNNQLIWKPELCLYDTNPADPLSFTVMYKSRTAMRGGNVAADETRQSVRGGATNDDLGIGFTVYPSTFGPSNYTTTHFAIQTFNFFSLANMQRLALALENAYTTIGKLGFKQTFPASWGNRIRVNVRKSGIGEEPENSYCVEPGMLGGPKLEFFEGVLVSENIGSIVIHELMHYHHYNYNTRCYTCLWLEEMCTAWSERLMSSDPENYVPKIYENPHGVLNGLPKVSVKPSLFSDGSVNKAAGSHGYNLYPFAVWLANKYPQNEIWRAIFESRGYQLGQALTALSQGLYSVDKEAKLGALYDEFVREYFSDKRTIPYPAPSMTPLNLFMGYEADNGKQTKIKAVGDLFLKDNIEHQFEMHSLGTATWLFTFEAGTDEFMKNYEDVLIKANSVDYDFFVLRFSNGKFSMTEVGDIVRDAEKNVSTIRFPLDSVGSAVKRTAFGIVAINHNYNDYDEARHDSLTLSAAFSGPLVVSGLVAKTPYEVLLNGVYLWTHDYTKMQSDLTFAPQGKTTFSDSSANVLKAKENMGASTDLPIVETHLGTETVPDTLEFNIAGTMTDLPVPKFLENSDSLFFGSGFDRIIWAECTNHYVVSVSKTVGNYSYNVNFTTGEGIGEYNAVYGGMTYTAEDFLPGADGLSRFNVTIPDVDPKATSYSLTIQTHYLTYSQVDETSQAYNNGSWNNLTIQFNIFLK